MSAHTHPMEKMRESLSLAPTLRIKGALLLIKSGRVNCVRFSPEGVINNASSLGDDITGAPALDPDRQRNCSHDGL